MEQYVEQYVGSNVIPRMRKLLMNDAPSSLAKPHLFELIAKDVVFLDAYFAAIKRIDEHDAAVKIY